jgi:CRP-like cAMP-binding protein
MIDRPTIRDFLDQLPYQNYLSNQIKSQLELHSKVIFLPGKTQLQPIGSTCKNIYFVFEGSARIFYQRDGTEITEYFARKGDILIRVESLLRNKSTKKGIESISKSVFLEINAASIFTLFEQDKNLEKWFNTLIQDAFIENVQRTEHFQILSPEERYFQLIQVFPDILNIAPLKYIASYLGITQVSLSRIRRRIDRHS